jgi:hypothetical protein
VIVYDLHVFGSCFRPTETQPELIIDTDAILPLAIASQGFQPITGRHPEIRQSSRDLELPQLTSCHSRDVHKSSDAITFRKSLRVDALERLNHKAIVTGCVITVNCDKGRGAKSKEPEVGGLKSGEAGSESYDLD